MLRGYKRRWFSPSWWLGHSYLGTFCSSRSRASSIAASSSSVSSTIGESPSSVPSSVAAPSSSAPAPAVSATVPASIATSLSSAAFLCVVDFARFCDLHFRLSLLASCADGIAMAFIDRVDSSWLLSCMEYLLRSESDSGGSLHSAAWVAADSPQTSTQSLHVTALVPPRPARSWRTILNLRRRVLNFVYHYSSSIPLLWTRSLSFDFLER